MATIDPRVQAQIDALTQGFKKQGNLGQLSPELLAYLSGQQGESANGGLLRGFTLDDGRRISQYGQFAIADPQAGPEAQTVSTDPTRVNWGAGPIDFMLNTDESNLAAMFDPKTGQFMGYEQREDGSSWKDFLTAAAMIIGGYYGGTYLSEAAAAGGTGGGVAGGGGAGGAGGAADWAGWAAGEGSGALAGSGYTGAEFTAGELAAGAGGAGGGAAGAGGSGAGGSGVNAMRAGEIAGYGTNGTMPSSAATVGGNMSAVDWLNVAANGTTGTEGLIGSGGNMAGTGTGGTAGLNNGGVIGSILSGLTGGNGNALGGLLGAYLGYQDNKDKQQTSKIEPWSEAQPYLKGLLSDGAALYGEYQQRPFSQAEQTAYGNYGNVLDYINGNAGGLLSGFQATAAGQNQFSRENPRKSLLGSTHDPATSPVAWRPGLLGSFGTRR